MTAAKSMAVSLMLVLIAACAAPHTQRQERYLASVDPCYAMGFAPGSVEAIVCHGARGDAVMRAKLARLTDQYRHLMTQNYVADACLRAYERRVYTGKGDPTHAWFQGRQHRCPQYE